METFQMSTKEINQVAVLEKLKNREIKQKHAALMLRLSIRQIQRKLKAYRRDRAKGLVHKLRGRPGNHCLLEGLKDQVINLVKKKYPDFGPTLASEKLAEIDGLVINRETLRLAMIEATIWQPKRRKIRHRQWRQRRECLGELVQFDGSEHDWFEGRANRCTLLAFIDDATSKVLYAEFVKAEATLTVMRASQTYLRLYGRPVEIYADRGKVVKVNQNNPDDEFRTQYRRALDELGIKISYALSPQAKGRVERLFGTFQDRLIKEMRLRNIFSIDQANEFLQTYLSIYNARFAVLPQEKADLHRSTKDYNLNQILCLKTLRSLKNDFTLRYRNQWYQLTKPQSTLIFPKDLITVSEHIDGRIRLSIRKVKLNFTRLAKAQKLHFSSRLKVRVKTQRKSWSPPANHPWRSFRVNV